MDDCDAVVHAEGNISIHPNQSFSSVRIRSPHARLFAAISIDGANWGTNILSEKGFGRNNKLDDPEEVLHHWVDQQKNRSFPQNSALTQVVSDFVCV